MTEFRWLTADSILAIHDRQLAEHGGPAGLKDAGLLESALGRPVNQHAYGSTDAADLAAAYAFGIARNHPFVDGNKRTAWIAARLFLRLNQIEITFDKADATETVLSLAAGSLSEAELAAWFRARIVPE
ncbi:MAG: type II toxin-antitoxin system death-on-curing family toxin [Pacificimonas sp.]|nr:type II toxin-antitoxin system death-on-curing family toxin [Pacificimonas sp.]